MKTNLEFRHSLITGILAAVSLLSSPMVSARGVGAGGGGDLCENRIQAIGYDIKDWIQKGGAASLALPSGIST